MCQAEVAHYANKLPEYLCSRPEKQVHFYKKALAVNVATAKAKARPQGPCEGDVDEDCFADREDSLGGARASAPGARKKAKLATKPSDLELYERRSEYWFAEGTPISRRVPPKETPEEQVADMCAWDFFRFVHLRGGRESLLEWYEPDGMPVVTMTPALKLGIG